MRPGIDTDPQAMRNFAEALRLFIVQVDESFDETRGRLAVMAEAWDDDQFHDFAGHFGATDRRLLDFMDEARKMVPRLHDDADRMDRANQGLKSGVSN